MSIGIAKEKEPSQFTLNADCTPWGFNRLAIVSPNPLPLACLARDHPLVKRSNIFADLQTMPSPLSVTLTLINDLPRGRNVNFSTISIFNRIPGVGSTLTDALITMLTGHLFRDIVKCSPLSRPGLIALTACCINCDVIGLPRQF
jgi:hypothetical protein